MLVNFRIAMLVRGISATELALSVGLNYTALSHIVHERRKAAPELRARLARELGVSEKWLFNRKPRPISLPRPTAAEAGGLVEAGA